MIFVDRGFRGRGKIPCHSHSWLCAFRKCSETAQAGVRATKTGSESTFPAACSAATLAGLEYMGFSPWRLLEFGRPIHENGSENFQELLETLLRS